MDYQQHHLAHSRTRSQAGHPVKPSALTARQGIRVPLGEIKSSENINRPIKSQQAFAVYDENKASTSSLGGVKSTEQKENASTIPPPQLPTFGGLRQTSGNVAKPSTSNIAKSATVWPAPPQVREKTIWPPPPPIPEPSSLPFTIFQDLPVPTKTDTRPQLPIGAERNQNRASQKESINLEDLENIAPTIPSYARTEFRQTNESILSTSPFSPTNDQSCDEDDSPMAMDGSMIERESTPADPICDVDDYTLDVVIHTKAVEGKYLPKWNYMSKQPDITYTMRSILVDWLVEVGEEYRLHTETLFLAVNYIDRFLSFMSVQRAKLQLVGTACMFIAAKYEEIYPPEVSEFCYITDDTYNKKQVLRMEHLILEVLGFECSPPTAHFFVNHFAKLSGCPDDSEAKCLAQYLAELTLLDAQTYLHYLPSVIGAASVALARHTLGLAAWDSSMVTKTGYKVDDFKACLICLHETFTNAPNSQQQAIREKYKNEKYHMVSQLRPTPIF